MGVSLLMVELEYFSSGGIEKVIGYCNRSQSSGTIIQSTCMADLLISKTMLEFQFRREMNTYTEILQQAESIGNLVASQKDSVIKLAEKIKDRKVSNVFLAARGTSDNAGRYANYLFGNRNGLLLAMATPSLFTSYRTPPMLTNSLVIGISQSGESPDIVSVLKEGRRQNCLTVALTNAPSSPLAKNADHILELRTGLEVGVAATKTYTAELTLLAMLSIALNGTSSDWNELDKLHAWIEKVLKLDGMIKEQVERYRYMERGVVLSRGYNYSTAFEWALKLKELTYVYTEPFSSADFMHGPVAMIESGYPVLMVTVKGRVSADLLETQRLLKNKLNAELVAISNIKESLKLADTPIEIPSQIPEWLTPIVAIVPAQLFAYHLALAKEIDPDHPRTISKITRTQ